MLIEFIQGVLGDAKRRMDRALQDLTADEINWRPSPQANSIGFIVWHVTRVEDAWIGPWAQEAQEVWERDDFAGRFNMPEVGHGIGLNEEQIAAQPAFDAEALRDYFDAVRAETLLFLSGLDDAALETVPGRLPFPELPGAGRFASYSLARMFRQLSGEEQAHLGQVAYVRGLQRGLDD